MNKMDVSNFENIYKLEEDVIKLSGEEAIQRLASKGNIVYFDFEKIENDSLNEDNKYRYLYEDILKYINENGKYNYENKYVEINSGGVLTWDNIETENDIVHITKSPGLESRLKRRGLKVDFPKFLVYGNEVLNQGFVDINFNGDPKNINYEEICEILDYEPNNNTIIRINKSDNLLLQINYHLISHSDGTRFSINEDKIPNLDFFNVNKLKSKITGLKPRNLEQKISLKNFLKNEIEYHFVVGGSGSGKSVMSYAMAVADILGTEKLRKLGDIKENIKIFKTNDFIGGKSRDLGIMPGNEFKKTFNFMKSYIDSHNLCGLGELIPFMEMLAHPKIDTEDFPARIKDGFGDGLYLPSKDPAIEIEHLQYGRGRTFEKKTIMIEEAQNYSPFEMKQLIERVGNYSKVYIIGDYEQTDNPKLSPDFNGLVYAANRFAGVHPAVTFNKYVKNYRGQGAEIMRQFRTPRDY